MDEGYNGWKNYETWCVNLWLTNDEVTYHKILDLIKKTEDGGEASNKLKEYVEELVLPNQPTLIHDLLGASLSEVDWFEIAKGFMEE